MKIRERQALRCFPLTRAEKLLKNEIAGNVMKIMYPRVRGGSHLVHLVQFWTKIGIPKTDFRGNILTDIFWKKIRKFGILVRL